MTLVNATIYSKIHLLNRWNEYSSEFRIENVCCGWLFWLVIRNLCISGINQSYLRISLILSVISYENVRWHPFRMRKVQNWDSGCLNSKNWINDKSAKLRFRMSKQQKLDPKKNSDQIYKGNIKAVLELRHKLPEFISL
jgi:hypothetical protein